MTAATARRRRKKTTAATDTVRVAIYTRQSVADDKEFGSLEAQREAVESYVRSQPGWVALPERYDDAGYSGGNIDRPAFQRLLRDIEAGGIDLVATYKLDRLSRSINDFVRITDLFERHGVRFVSTTQAFDTSSSVGRMTVNLLATFATFEREMIAERTRDKMAAARRKGLWTGGTVPLGYRVESKRLVPHPEEAEQVREIFKLYLELGSILAVSDEVNRRGWRTRSTKGRRGRPFDKNAVSRILKNPTYVGRVRYQGEVNDGAHEAIVDEAIWDQVQRQLERAGAGCAPKRPGKSGALLLGLIRCACGAAMTVHTARRNNRVYRSYVCTRYQKEGAASCPGSRVNVADLETVVIEKIRAIGRDPAVVRETLAAARREIKKRRPDLEAQLAGLEKRETKLSTERQNLLDAIAGNGKSPGLFEKLGEVEAELEEVRRSVGQVRTELAALDGQVVDEEDLRRALAAFDPVWEQLVPAEKARVVQLLVESVTYDARADEVEIELRPGGVKALGQDEKETA